MVQFSKMNKEDNFFQLIIKHTSDAVLVLDNKGIIRFLNPATERLFNRRAEQMVGQVFGFPIHRGVQKELDIMRPDKSPCVVEMHVVDTRMNGKTYYVINLHDTTEHVQLREDLRARTLVDELTGLYNRRGFLALAGQHLKLGQRTKKGSALLFADYDNLKQINDTLGHQKGDQALVDTADVFRKTFRTSDIIARYGGDEFVVLAIGARKHSLDTLTIRLQRNLEDHYKKDNCPNKLSLSIGSAYYDSKCPCTIEDLLVQADKSMYNHKNGREGFNGER
ncbi:MAG: sensor domain-containing diguanylate cyclase [bacterium]